MELSLRSNGSDFHTSSSVDLQGQVPLRSIRIDRDVEFKGKPPERPSQCEFNSFAQLLILPLFSTTKSRKSSISRLGPQDCPFQRAPLHHHRPMADLLIRFQASLTFFSNSDSSFPPNSLFKHHNDPTHPQPRNQTRSPLCLAITPFIIPNTTYHHARLHARATDSHNQQLHPRDFTPLPPPASNRHPSFPIQRVPTYPASDHTSLRHTITDPHYRNVEKLGSRCGLSRTSDNAIVLCRRRRIERVLGLEDREDHGEESGGGSECCDY